MKRKRDPFKQGFSFDFSSMSFGNDWEDKEEIPRLSYIPAEFRHAEDMAEEIDWTKDYISILAGTFVFGDLLEAIVYKHSLLPDKMYITTLGMNQENVDSLVNIVGYLGCKELNLIVSHYFAGVERHKLLPYMQKEFEGYNINIAVLQSHCKICIIRSNRGDGAIVGSANLSSSNNVEQMIIMHDPKTIDYLQGRLDVIMDKFTIYRGLDGELDMSKNKDNTAINAYKAITERRKPHG